MRSSTKYKVVIDTNVIISGLIFGGIPKQVMDLVHSDKVYMYISPELEQEILRKFHSITHRPEISILLQVILEKHCRKVIPSHIASISRDPKDDMLLALSLAGNADFLVTGDKDLLILQIFERTKIVTPKEFITVLP